MDNVDKQGGRIPPDFWVWTLAVAVMLWVLGMSLSGCSRTVYVPVETVSYVRDSASTVDSTATSHKTDILDSVRIKDSTVIIQDHEGNIVKEEHYRETERYRSLERAYDGLRRAYEQLKSEKVDSVAVPYPVERRLTRWERVRLDFGGAAIIAVLAVVVFFFGRLAYKARRR